MKASNTIQTLQKRNTPFTWMILFISFVFFVPSLMMKYIWMDLKSVHVQEETAYGDMVVMEIDREIIRDFHGTFTVSIRRTNGELVCQGRPDDSFEYKVESVLPIPVSLTYWLGGEEKMTRCRGNGFGEGTYYLDTCHTVVVGSIQYKLARRCVSSNQFTILGRENNDA